MCKTQQIDLTVFFGIHSIKTASPGDHARAKGLGNYLAVTPAAPGVHEKKKKRSFITTGPLMRLLYREYAMLTEKCHDHC